MKAAAVVLAAGASTRMGTPKQLLMYEGRSLLDRALDTAMALPVVGVTVVLGAAADTIRTAIDRSKRRGVDIAVNPDWALGMGGSIRTGFTAATHRHPDLDAVLIMLCDQPRVCAAALEQLLACYGKGECDAAAAGYAGTAGVPALFGRAMFPALRSLASAGGAKPLLTGPRVSLVPMPSAAIDVDTPDDFQSLKSG
jgi:molybdenum cofactor cytidylyltransferase